jgi:hypothetical protein
MKHHNPVSHEVHTLPEKELYKYNKVTDPLERKGTEFHGTTHYNKAAAKEIQPHFAGSNIYNYVDKPVNVDKGENHYGRKRNELKTHWQFTEHSAD